MAAARKASGLYLAKESSEASTKRLPLSEGILGFYCNAGIEPSEFDENGVVGKTNQDKAFISYPLHAQDDSEWICAGVFDGLGLYGDMISDFCVGEFVAALQRHPLRIAKPATALKDAFLEADDEMRRQEELKFLAVSSGCAACVVVLHRYSLHVANLGDSAVVLGHRQRRTGKNSGASGADPDAFAVVAKKLTREHTPTDLAERARCITKGAHVSQPSEQGLADARVWRNPEMTEIGLTVSRSLGHHGARSIGVTAEAEVREVILSSDDLFLIIGSDGLWQFIDPQEACDLVNNELKQQGSNGRGAIAGGGGRFASTAAAQLMELAKARWREEEDDFRDDISVVVLKLPVTSGDDTPTPPAPVMGGNRGSKKR